MYNMYEEKTEEGCFFYNALSLKSRHRLQIEVYYILYDICLNLCVELQYYLLLNSLKNWTLKTKTFYNSPNIAYFLQPKTKQQW